MAGTTWNPADKHADVTLSNGNLTAAQSATVNNRGVRAVEFKAAGKFYFEIEVDSASGSPDGYFGLSDNDEVLTAALGNGAEGYAYHFADGDARNNGSESAYGDSLAATDILGVAVDFTAGAIWFSKNGTWQGGATIGEVEAGTTTNAAFTSITSNPLTPAASLNATITITLHSDAANLTYTVPTGFTAGWPETINGDGVVALGLGVSGTASNPNKHGDGTIALPLGITATASNSTKHGDASIALTPIVAGSGSVGFAGGLTLGLGTLEFAGSGQNQFLGTADLGLGEIEITGSGQQAYRGAAQFRLGTLGASFSGYQTFVGALTAALGTLGFDGAGHIGITGSMTLALGELGLALYALVPVDDTWHIVAINLRTGAVTEYADFEFNSLIEWNGSYYGASESGIYLLEGDDDLGDAIAAYARTGITDHGTEITKRVTDAYVTAKSTSPLTLAVYRDEGAVRHAYDVPTHTKQGHDVFKADLGRGGRARFLQYEIGNQAGADMEVDGVDLIVMPQERRRKR